MGEVTDQYPSLLPRTVVVIERLRQRLWRLDQYDPYLRADVEALIDDTTLYAEAMEGIACQLGWSRTDWQGLLKALDDSQLRNLTGSP